MIDLTERLLAQPIATAARVEEIATTSGVVHQELLLQVQVLNGKYDELVAFYQSGGPAPARPQPQLQARDEGFQTSVSQAVHWNVDLLNKLVTRVNILEASAALVTGKVRVAIDGVNELNVARDKHLRDELSMMALRCSRRLQPQPRMLPALRAPTSCGSVRPSTAFRPR